MFVVSRFETKNMESYDDFMRMFSCAEQPSDGVNALSDPHIWLFWFWILPFKISLIVGGLALQKNKKKQKKPLSPAVVIIGVLALEKNKNDKKRAHITCCCNMAKLYRRNRRAHPSRFWSLLIYLGGCDMADDRLSEVRGWNPRQKIVTGKPFSM